MADNEQVVSDTVKVGSDKDMRFSVIYSIKYHGKRICLHIIKYVNQFAQHEKIQ